MNLETFNSLPKEQLFTELEKCCGSKKWIQAMIKARPFKDIESIHCISDSIWSSVANEDILEAFKHHPQIGNIESLKQKFASTSHWASSEQKATEEASDEVLFALKKGNEDYLQRFGFIFIVCATGKTAQEMLKLLQSRITNKKDKELMIAAAEQNKITHLRLDKLLENKI